ncbi:hypothetical protein [Tenuibacillus multivorans]|uniref:Uncharacterized protein n=1 Tax=Tenuibacillus multivorans TaxID=237069 RepID=A0A1H0APJ5_9BACI|nr:hypothetical protein [Tenuibacillus multivorans]GEL78212.1 hypothetical protein TMU01_24470 [Tenuibacillus multivorans]SDN34856.1 hypothetical protein SAMN05216498_2005 [Tenuibacillus multivorans]
MELVSSLLPIILLLIILFIIIGFVSKTTSIFKFSSKRNAIVVGYVAVLIIATTVYFVVVQGEDLVQEVDQGQVVELREEYNEAIQNEDYDDDSVRTVNQWTFKATKNPIVITGNVGYPFGSQVVERNDDYDEIRVTQYMMNYDHELLDQLPELYVELTGGPEREKVLRINKPGEYMQVKVLAKEFPLRQLEGISLFDIPYIKGSDGFHQFLYIEVPSDVEVTRNELIGG